MNTVRALAGAALTGGGLVLMAAMTPPDAGHWSLIAVSLLISGGLLLAYSLLDLLGVGE
jgi:hypothetical protein